MGLEEAGRPPEFVPLPTEAWLEGRVGPRNPGVQSREGRME